MNKVRKCRGVKNVRNIRRRIGAEENGISIFKELGNDRLRHVLSDLIEDRLGTQYSVQRIALSRLTDVLTLFFGGEPNDPFRRLHVSTLFRLRRASFDLGRWER